MSQKFFISFLIIGVLGLGNICLTSFGNMPRAEASVLDSNTHLDCGRSIVTHSNMNCCTSSYHDEQVVNAPSPDVQQSQSTTPSVFTNVALFSLSEDIQKYQNPYFANSQQRSPPLLTGIIVKKE